MKGTPHLDSTKEKASTKIQRLLNSSMWQTGDISGIKNLPIHVKDACTALCSERGACTAENVVAAMVGVC